MNTNERPRSYYRPQNQKSSVPRAIRRFCYQQPKLAFSLLVAAIGMPIFTPLIIKPLWYAMTMPTEDYKRYREEQFALMRRRGVYGEGLVIPFFNIKFDLSSPHERELIAEREELDVKELQKGFEKMEDALGLKRAT